MKKPLLLVCCLAITPLLAETDRDRWANEMLKGAEEANQRAVEFDNKAKTATGQEAWQWDEKAQYERGMAQRKQALAEAIKAGDQAQIEAANRAMKDFARSSHQQPAAPEAMKKDAPFSLDHDQKKDGFAGGDLGQNPPEPNLKKKEHLNQRADRLDSLAKDLKQMADHKREWAKEQRGKWRRAGNDFSDFLEKTADLQHALAAAMRTGDENEINKARGDLQKQMKDFDKLAKDWNFSFPRPDFGVAN